MTCLVLAWSTDGAVIIFQQWLQDPRCCMHSEWFVCRGWRNVLLEEGPEAWARKIREHKPMLITDTTWCGRLQPGIAHRLAHD